jgi:hypothetical protein
VCSLMHQCKLSSRELRVDAGCGPWVAPRGETCSCLFTSAPRCCLPLLLLLVLLVSTPPPPVGCVLTVVGTGVRALVVNSHTHTHTHTLVNTPQARVGKRHTFVAHGRLKAA